MTEMGFRAEQAESKYMRGVGGRRRENWRRSFIDILCFYIVFCDLASLIIYTQSWFYNYDVVNIVTSNVVNNAVTSGDECLSVGHIH